MTSFFNMLGHVTLATILLIVGSEWFRLPTFGRGWLPDWVALGLAVMLSVFAMIFLMLLGGITHRLFRLKKGGFLLSTLMGTIAGSLSLWLVHIMLPAVVHLSGPLSAVPYALFNTLLIWNMGIASGTVDIQAFNMLPTYEDQQ